MLRTIGKVVLIAAVSCGAAGMLRAVDVQRFQRQPDWNALHMDGKLGDPFWQKIKAPLSTFHVFQEKDKTTDDTRVKITFDDTWLYFGLECVNMEPGYDRNTVKMHDGAVSADDSVEIFISADKDRGSYYHFFLNCDNVKAEQKAVGSGDAAQRDRTWNPVWLSRSAKNDHGWTAEIAIPLTLLAENGKVGMLSFNIARTKLIPEFDSQGVRLGEHRQASSLFPVKDSFHEPGSFAELKGLEAVKVKEPCQLKLDGSAIESFYVKDGKTFYDVFVKISYGGKGNDCADITVVDKPEQGEQVEVTVPGKWIGPSRQETVRLSIPVASMAQRTAMVILKDYFTKGVVEQSALSNMDKLTPLDAYFSRNYYTSEKNAELACRVSLPSESLIGTRIILKDGQSNELFRTDAIKADNLFQVGLTKVPPGETSVVLELVDKEGKTLFHKALILTKRTPKPGHEWKIDQLNGVLLNNGNPVFPFGVIFYQYTEDKLMAIKNMGCNMFFKEGGSFPDDIFIKAASNDLYVMDILENYSKQIKIPNLSKYLSGDEFKKADDLYNANRLQSTLNYGQAGFKELTRIQRNEIFDTFYKEELPDIMAGIKAAAQHKALMGYETFDEPGFAGFDMFVQGRDLYKKTNKADGYHPTLALYSSYIPPGSEATDWCDILCTDPYWIPDGTLKERSTISFVSKIVRQTRERADAARKMTWIVPMGSRWSATHRRLLTPAEQICQSYLCIIHGAKAITYYMLPEHKLLQDAIKTFGAQLAVLAPALLAPAVKQEMAYTPVEFIPEKDSFPAVQAALFQYPSGEALLLVANTVERQIKVSYSLSCLPEKGEVKRLFTQETFQVSGKSFNDSLEPFGVRAYAMAQKVKPGEVVKVLVKSEPDESVPPPAARLPTVDYWGRTGKKNVAPNPSFEEVTIPDLPDYVMPGGKTTIGFTNAHMRVVTTDPYDGKVCLQLTNPEENTPLKYVGFNVACAPQNPKTETYTWSIYMKGDRDGLQVLIGCHDMKEWDGKQWVKTWKTVELSKEWKRYSVTGPVPANVYRKCGLEFQLRSYGTIWVDAMQFEKGDTPTAFEN